MLKDRIDYLTKRGFNYKVEAYVYLAETFENQDFFEKTEKHHLLPRCCGGLDDKINLVNITHEHHKLLHKFIANMMLSGLDLSLKQKADLQYAADKYDSNKPKSYDMLQVRKLETKYRKCKDLATRLKLRKRILTAKVRAGYTLYGDDILLAKHLKLL